MTDITINLDGPRCLLDMKGHATSSNLVCCACSAIGYTVAGYLLNAEDLHTEGDFRHVIESGRMTLTVTGDDAVQEVFRAAAIGFAQIEKANPGEIVVNFQEA